MNQLVNITEELLKENFKNTFLELVAFEVRFPTDLTIHSIIPEFQGSIKDLFPVYSEGFSIPVGLVSNIEKSNLLNYAFKNKIEDIEIYLNTYSVFGIRTKNYLGFENFSKVFLDYLKKLVRICKIKKFTRLGLRYVNIVPLQKDLIVSNKLTNLYFNSLITERLNNKKFENQHIDLKYKEDLYEIHQQFFFRRSPTELYEAVIDLDNSLKGEINVLEDLEDFNKLLNDLHNLIKIKFFEIIKQEFLKKLRENKGE